MGTKKQTQGPVAEFADACGMPYVNQRWLGGMLTNFATVSGRVKRMQELRAMQAAGDFDAMPKKEALRHVRELEKLGRNLGGISRLDRLPDAIFVIDTKKEHIAVTEARKLGLPVVAVVDTNCDPDVITYVIPGNDDAIRSGTLLCRVMADAVVEGRWIAQHRPAPAGRGSCTACRGTPASAPPRGPRGPRSTGSCRRRGNTRARGGDPRGRSSIGSLGRRRPPPPRDTAPAADRDRRRRHRRAGRRAEGLSMPGFTAKDVQALRQSTGVGMLDAKRALDENGGDMDAARRWLREKGLADRGRRAEREASQGAVAVVKADSVAAIVELRCETDFVAKADDFVSLADELAEVVAAKGEDAVEGLADEVARLATTLKENISVGRVVRLEAGEGEVIDTLPAPAGRPRRQCRRASCSGAAPRRSPTTSPCTSPSPGRPTCGARTCPRPRWPTSAPPSRRSAATRASPRPRCPRSSKAG